MTTAIQSEIALLEERRWRAMLENDLATLEALLDDELSYTHSSAVVDTKQSYLESMRSGNVRYREAQRDAANIRAVNDALAIVTGGARILVNVKGQDKTINMRYSNVWVKRAGGWKFLLWHSTVVPV
jgi:hypothetical protein